MMLHSYATVLAKLLLKMIESIYSAESMPRRLDAHHSRQPEVYQLLNIIPFSLLAEYRSLERASLFMCHWLMVTERHCKQL